MLNKNVKNDTHPSELDGEEAHEEGGYDEKGAHHRPHHQERWAVLQVLGEGQHV